eukprot:GHVT01033437.1.p1 GENE.GHVT01033437.1~~GHVT01033437.1.p1  ORF type:complete len:257 (-),score=45.63 GHVT01033437.1:1337-2107(-)
MVFGPLLSRGVVGSNLQGGGLRDYLIMQLELLAIARRNAEQLDVFAGDLLGGSGYAFAAAGQRSSLPAQESPAAAAAFVPSSPGHAPPGYCPVGAIDSGDERQPTPLTKLLQKFGLLDAAPAVAAGRQLEPTDQCNHPDMAERNGVDGDPGRGGSPRRRRQSSKAPVPQQCEPAAGWCGELSRDRYGSAASPSTPPGSPWNVTAPSGGTCRGPSPGRPRKTHRRADTMRPTVPGRGAKVTQREGETQQELATATLK